MKTTNRILRRKAVSDKSGLPLSSMYRAIAEGTFPDSIPLGTGRAVGWLESDIDEWIHARIAASKTEA